jgi:hypothetical protein
MVQTTRIRATTSKAPHLPSHQRAEIRRSRLIFGGKMDALTGHCATTRNGATARWDHAGLPCNFFLLLEVTASAPPMHGGAVFLGTPNPSSKAGSANKPISAHRGGIRCSISGAAYTNNLLLSGHPRRCPHRAPSIGTNDWGRLCLASRSRRGTRYLAINAHNGNLASGSAALLNSEFRMPVSSSCSRYCPQPTPSTMRRSRSTALPSARSAAW